MSSFIITYDLVANRNYDELFNAIKKYGTFAHVLESVWIVKSSSSSTDIRDNLKSYLDSDDKIFVAKLNGQSAWKNLSNEVSDWIHNNT